MKKPTKRKSGGPKGHPNFNTPELAKSKGVEFVPGGRPTKLTPELVEKAESYLEWCESSPLKTKEVVTLTGAVIGHETKPRLPTVAGLACYLRISRDSLYAWAKEDKRFSDILGDVTAAAEKMLCENGTAGIFNPLMAKFLLSADHNKREKSDVTSDGKALPAPILGGAAKE